MNQSLFATASRIEMIDPTDLVPNPSNPRKHSPKQIQQIGASIKRFGFLIPIIIDEDRMILAGHGRREAAISLGLTQVPTIEAQFLTEADKRAFALAENRIAELSEWDEDLLKIELEHLFELNYDIDIAGFGLGDLDFDKAASSKKRDVERVELPDPDAKAVSRMGDLWSIGPHRLLHGDATQVASFEQLLGDERATMIVSDPPYNVPIMGHVAGLGQARYREFAMASGEMTSVEFTAFLRTVFKNCVRFSTDGSIHDHFMDWRHMREILDAADGVYNELKQLLVWVKQQPGMGAFYRSQHELIFVFKSGRGRHINNFQLGQSGRHRSNVLQYPGVNTFGRGAKQAAGDHPTPKNSTMIADLLLDCSNRGDLVLDPFSGSATTLVAAHRTKRRGVAIEIDPLYVDAGVRRMQDATGLDAILGDGTTFAEARARRAGQEVADHD